MVGSYPVYVSGSEFPYTGTGNQLTHTVVSLYNILGQEVKELYPGETYFITYRDRYSTVVDFSPIYLPTDR
jgi:hypothetical protein